MNKSSIWTNKDGLAVGFGTRDVEKTGSYVVDTDGSYKELVVRLVLSDLADTIDVNDVVNAPVIPSGSFISSALLVVETAAVGATAVLDIGLCTVAGVDVDDDGIDAAIATATLVTDYDTACDGAKIGLHTTADWKVYASYDTAAFTAGVVKVVIKYLPPEVLT